MAQVTIEDAVVQSLIPGYGFRCMTTINIKGKEINEFYTVWNNKVAVKQYDRVNITGRLQVKLSEYETKDKVKRQGIQININDAEVVLAEAPLLKIAGAVFAWILASLYILLAIQAEPITATLGFIAAILVGLSGLVTILKRD